MRFGRRHWAASAAACAVLLAFGWWYLRGGGDGFLAVATAPQAVPSRSDTATGKLAEEMFWRTLHEGRYEDIPATIEVLTKAFKEHPYDPAIARRLGFLHGWKLVERNRMQTITSTIADEAVLSQYYYDAAYRLDPTDDRMIGLKAVLRMLNGQLNDDQKAIREGYFMGHEANRRFPQFNYFAISVPLATLPYTDPRFKEAVEMQWQLLDSCDSWTDLKLNLSREEYAKRFPGPKRVCWDNWIAPHNIKGTLLHMGDILVKDGDWKKGVEIYQRIKAIQDYENWPLKDFLEERIRDAQANVENFRVDYTKRLTEHVTRPAMLIDTGYVCVSCHQEKGSVPALPNFPAPLAAGASKQRDTGGS
ncbi:MAG: hypothetical protein ABI605_11660 [Rhizobacter sp.]